MKNKKKKGENERRKRSEKCNAKDIGKKEKMKEKGK